MSDIVADINRHGVALVERLLDDIDPGFGPSPRRATDVAAHQLLWARYIITGAPLFGDCVLQSLRQICSSALVDHVRGGVYCFRTTGPERRLGDNAQLLELLTWVWRVERCPLLKDCAMGIVAWAVTQMRVTGSVFAASLGHDAHDGSVPADGSSLMIVALVEAGSVFERREWLALARDIFDEIVASRACAGEPRRSVTDNCATMSRAAIRLFEAFGKRHYLDFAETWVASLDAALRDIAIDRALSIGDALMIGVLARLHALTGTSHYAERATHLVQALHPAIMRSGPAGATAVANVQTAAQLVSIKVSGDPRLPNTRELMRIALDCGLPDRLVLGPGAGGAPGERPLVHVGIGASRIAPIDDAAQLRTMLAPGGLAAAFLHGDTRETVDSRRTHDIV